MRPCHLRAVRIMKTKTILVVLLFLAAPLLAVATAPGENGAQAGPRAEDDKIEWINPKPTGSTLYGMAWSASADHAILVGQAGAALRYAPFSAPKFSMLTSGVSDDLNAIAYKPDGSYAVVVGDAGTVLKWDGSTFTSLGHVTNSNLNDVAWNPAGSSAMIAGDDGAILNYDGTSLIGIYCPSTYDFRGVSWVQGSSSAILVGEKGVAYWGNRTGCLQINSSFSKDLSDIAYRPDGAYAIAVGADGTVLKFNAGTFTTFDTAPYQYFYSIAWKPDSSSAILVGTDLNAITASVWGLDSSTIYAIPTNITVTMRIVMREPGTDAYLIAGSRGLVVEYIGGAFDILSSAQMYDMNSVAWRSDGSYALIVGTYGYLAKFNGTTLVQVNTGVISELKGVAWHPDYEYALICARDGTVLRYNDTNSTVDVLTTGLVVPINYTSVSWKPDGSYALLAGDAGGLVKFNGTAFENQQVIGAYAINFMDVAWKPDGAYAVIAAVSGNVLKYEEQILPPQYKISKISSTTTLPPSTAYFGISWKNNPAITDALICGMNGVVLHLNESGMSPLTTDTTRFFYGIGWMPNSSYAMVVGAYGKIATYVKYGFIHPTSGTDTSFLDIGWKPDGSYAVIIGQSGAVVKYTLGKRTTPKAIISSPRPNAVYEPGVATFFDGMNSTPTYDDTLTYHWESNISGGFSDSGRFTKLLDPGKHLITLYANDTQGHSSTATVMITVKQANRAPTIKLNSPREAEIYNNTDPIQFDATGSSDLDGDALSYYWTSSKQAYINASVSFTSTLNIGAHMITLYVNDNHGHNVSASVNITVILFNRRPVPIISSPVGNEIYLSNKTVAFDASNSRDDDGDTLSYYWTSNMTGYLGSTARFNRLMSVGAHRITVWVDDDKGGNASTAINITIEKANEAPTMTIDSPADGAKVSGTVEFTGVAIDRDGTVKLVSVQVDEGDWFVANGTGNWSYSLDTNGMTNGVHTIKAKASDGQLESAVITRSVTVHNPLWGFSVTIGYPTNGTTVNGKTKIMGTASRIGSTITIVQIKFDQGEWQTAMSTGSWEYLWDTAKVKNGVHTVTVRCYDGTDYSWETATTLKVDNKTVTTSNLGMYAIIAVILIMAIIACAFLMMRRSTDSKRAEKAWKGREDE
jgi:hypothetical protein